MSRYPEGPAAGECPARALLRWWRRCNSTERPSLLEGGRVVRFPPGPDRLESTERGQSGAPMRKNPKLLTNGTQCGPFRFRRNALSVRRLFLCGPSPAPGEKRARSTPLWGYPSPRMPAASLRQSSRADGDGAPSPREAWRRVTARERSRPGRLAPDSRLTPGLRPGRLTPGFRTTHPRSTPP